MLGGTAFLSVRGIRKSFGPVKVLHGVDLDLAPGSVTALLGENGAGKSTFVRILAGDHSPDEGEITLDGTEVTLRSVGQARAAGIRLIAQEIADAPPLSVAENITLGAPPARWGFVRRAALEATAARALEALGAQIPLGARVSSLRLGERQIIEIARATIGRSRCVIFDEPTAALSDAETRRLFDLIARMRADGKAILYITHRLDEVFEIADRVCVLRDGRVSLNRDVAEVTQDQVVTAMVGRALVSAPGGSDDMPAAGAEMLQVKELSGDGFDGINLDVRAGEIVGLYGKIGSGVPELAATLFGSVPRTAGSLRLSGKEVRFSHPADAVAQGIGFLPADRAHEGLLGVRSVAENLSAPSWRRMARGPLIRRAQERSAFAKWHRAMNIRSGIEGREKITQLSGGNQQKVLLGRWLEKGSKLLLLVEPTRGVDVGAREEIYDILRGLARDGHGILIASSDYEDITHAATRAEVMVRGRIVARLSRRDISVASLTEAAGGATHV
ncbi:Arabinose import ATP-binding protein AraG [Aquimixticola soesokkakensis]|uniref:Arabinose import ATP-binding protein AraG n=1 Tax=Aquimixticola soesokkakensis TaxID=1519096 RepID=A0A1Y5TGJ6_9RHOB|nr:sugar ABC transporter ATP-binding protein [Aquimixticola soesokkakensis]SLN63557.1 Arabinose import ATP-binding protein AraG [Aquimixticola soesokkakensis]